MDYLNKIEEIGGISASAVTLGKFDGLHLGHQKLIRQILKQKSKDKRRWYLPLIREAG